MGSASDFSWTERKNGDVAIEHHGKQVAILRGARAAKFVAQVAECDEDELMARITGNYKRGNERAAKQHPRNR